MKHYLLLLPFLRNIIFGNKFCNILLHEGAPNNKRYAPGYFPFSLYCQLNSVPPLQDIIFCIRVDEKTEFSYHLTSIRSLQNAAGYAYKCWGWPETTSALNVLKDDGVVKIVGLLETRLNYKNMEK